jgi:hypothetical protein
MLSMLWPEASVVAMDTGYERPTRFAHKAFDNLISFIRGADCYREYGDYGIDLTNRLLQKNKLNAKVIHARSPKDTRSVVQDHLKAPPDFIFIDGQHTPEQMLLDFSGCREVSAPDCVYLFHDIVNWELIESFEDCKASSKLSGGLLRRTTSGMGLLFPQSRPDVERVFKTFGGPADFRRGVGWRAYTADFVARMVLHNPLVRLVSEALRR